MTSTTRILAVDDNPLNRDILEEILGDCYELRLAAEGLECLRIAQDWKPHLVLLDVMLPDIDGCEVCQRLRSLPELADVRVVLVSARAMARDQSRGLTAGADAYVTKPFLEEDLLAAIERIGLVRTCST